MKSLPQKQATLEEPVTGPRYWKSLDDLTESPDFKTWVHREFPQGASEIEGVNRRKFMKIMGASFALAGFGLAGCRRPEQHIVPYSKQPENMIPGVPTFFATSMPDAMDSIPLVVETHSARPTKVEGNGNFKPYGGATNAYAQASVLDLYDQDRAQKSRQCGESNAPLSQAEIRDLLQRVSQKYAAVKGEGLALLANGSTSVTRARLLKELKNALPKAVIAEYDPIRQDASELAAQAATGKRLRPYYKFAQAKRVLSLDSDFLHHNSGAMHHARGFADARRVYKSEDAHKMNRLYQVESDFSITGGMADHRLRLATSHIPAFTAAIAAEILSQKGMDASLVSTLTSKASDLDVKNKDEWLKACASDLIKHSGKTIIVAGEHLPVEVHQLVFFLNEILEAPGRTIDYLAVPEKVNQELPELAEAIKDESIQTLFVLGGNPVYNAPADLNWKKLQASVPEVIRYGYHYDETSASSQVHIAATHYLESWNDGRTYDGTIVPVQPMILPLFESFQELEVLARLGGGSVTDPYELVFNTLASRVLDVDKEKAFNRFLNRGFLPKSEYSITTARTSKDALKKAAAAIPAASKAFSKKSLEVRILPSSQVLDGRYNNNGWLQELPEPINKTTWDNTINISPRLAKELGFDPKTARLVAVSAKHANTHEAGRQVAPVGKLTVNGTTITGPINIQPGLSNYTVTVAMGYGRSVSGRIGQGIGFDVFPIVSSDNPSYVGGAALEITTDTYEIGNTQEHWSMEGRAIIREANADYYEKHPDFVDHMGAEAHSPPIYGKKKDKPLEWKATNQPKGGGLYETPTFTAPQQWGMSIDLNTCTGCNECVVACQSENNIPIVGKEQVIAGREMHWIRMDRYYSSGDKEKNFHEIPEDPQVSMQPMACQQCEMAPCEQVCPVNATVHDSQGLNTMAYNRCVGTRYCANNCPYKVRRFNFFDWNKRQIGHHREGPLGPNDYETQGGKLHAMQRNPDVSVRMRGVMEKCTYCQQRIEAAKINQKAKAKDSNDIKVADRVIKVACEQACPTGAIIFGDIADTETDVYKAKQSDRDYSVLGYLNVRPRTTYLARLRNPNPQMPDYQTMPLSLQEHNAGHAGHGDEHSQDGHDNHHDDHNHG